MALTSKNTETQKAEIEKLKFYTNRFTRLVDLKREELDQQYMMEINGTKQNQSAKARLKRLRKKIQELEQEVYFDQLK